MKKSTVVLTVAFAIALVASSGRAMEVSGVKFDDKIDVGGVPLVLNGAGLRTKVMLKIYVVGLYVPKPMKSAEAVITAKEPRRVPRERPSAPTVGKISTSGLNPP